MERDNEVINVNIEEIIPNRFQPRLSFEPEALKELSESIKQHGIFQPLVVRRVGNKFEIIAGERRYKAATLAGFKEVPCIVVNLDDNESAEIALVENLQRKDLTPIEEAKSYKKLLDRGYVTQEQLAKRMGRSQPAIANKIRLLNLTNEVQQALLETKISERHARSLLAIKDPTEQIKLLNEIITRRLTVRDTDMEVKKIMNENETKLPDFIPFKEEIKSVVENEQIKIEPSISLEDLAKNDTPVVAIEPLVPTIEAPKPIEDTFVDIDKLTKATNDLNVAPAKPDIIELLKIEEIKEPLTQITEAPVAPVVEIQPSVVPTIEPIINEIPVIESIPNNLSEPFEEVEPIQNISVSEIPTIMEQPEPNIIPEDPMQMINNFEQIKPIVEEVKSPEIQEFKPMEEISPIMTQPVVEEVSKEDIPLINQIVEPPFVFDNPQKPVPYEPEVQVEAPKPTTATYVTNNLRTAINTTRDCVATLEKFGFNVDKEEMDLEDSYQIIIKIHKTDV